MQQKLITIWLNGRSRQDNQEVEHLKTYLAEGWVIKGVYPVGSAGDARNVAGIPATTVNPNQSYESDAWLTVLLEKM